MKLGKFMVVVILGRIVRLAELKYQRTTSGAGALITVYPPVARVGMKVTLLSC